MSFMMSFKCMVVGFSIHSLFAGRLHRCVVYPYTRYTKTNALASMQGSITPALLPLGHARQWVNINTGTHTHREESHTYCASPTTLTHSHTRTHALTIFATLKYFSTGPTHVSLITLLHIPHVRMSTPQ